MVEPTTRLFAREFYQCGFLMPDPQHQFVKQI